jgi:histone-lysine N-methyltransferase SETMAR
MEWRHKNSPTKKKFKAARSTGKFMCTDFWDRKGVILVDFLEQCLTINAARCVETLKKLKSRIARVWPKKKEHVLLQHDNARPHTALLTRECTAKFGWTVLPHPPYSPDLAPSDFHLFGPMKDGLQGKQFPNTDAVIEAVKKWLSQTNKTFMGQGYRLVECWRKCIEGGGDFVEK